MRKLAYDYYYFSQCMKSLKRHGVPPYDCFRICSLNRRNPYKFVAPNANAFLSGVSPVSHMG